MYFAINQDLQILTVAEEREDILPQHQDLVFSYDEVLAWGKTVLIDLYKANDCEPRSYFGKPSHILKLIIGEFTMPVKKKAAAKKKAPAKKAPAKKAAAKPDGRGRPVRFPNDHVIKVIAAENPRRPGSRAHRHFKLYALKKVKTVADFLKAGGIRLDLKEDSEQGYIQVCHPKTGEVAP